MLLFYTSPTPIWSHSPPRSCQGVAPWGPACLAAPDGTGSDGPRLLVPLKDLRDTAVWDTQVPADYTGSHSLRGELNYLQPDLSGQGPPVDEHAP